MCEKVQKVLGSAHYEARRVTGSSLIRLTAAGVLPCSNYTAQLEMRSERVIPPMWNFVFYLEGYCQKALRPFMESVVMINSTGANAIVVHDAAGIQEVPILQTFEPAFRDENQHVVYARLPKEDDRVNGCQIASADTLLNAYHYKAFGPAPLRDCQDFFEHNKIQQGGGEVAGGEIPWPLLS